MTCAICAQRIERDVRKLSGVKSAAVNFASEKLFIEYDESALKLSTIKEAIAKLGYSIVKEKNQDTLWTKFIISVVFVLPLLYVAMAPMLRMPFPKNYAIIELLLVLPIIGAGYQFYMIGFKSLWQRSPNMDSLIAIGTSAAVLYSLFNMAAGPLYFDSAGMIITLILLGKSLEAVSKGRTSEAIQKLMGLAPKTAVIKTDTNWTGAEFIIDGGLSLVI